jgi:hypothetical protein
MCPVRRPHSEDAPGFLLAFEVRLAYLQEIPATEVSDGSTCTQGTIPSNWAGSSRHLTWPSGALWKDCETFDKALDLAASNDELYLRIYIYNDSGEILHEAGCYREQLKKIHELEEQRPARAQDERPKT